VALRLWILYTHSYADLSDILPIPTRRSSDLERAFAAGADGGELAAGTPISLYQGRRLDRWDAIRNVRTPLEAPALVKRDRRPCGDRKSKRLNSSHVANSYAVFCLKKKMTRRC